MESGQIAFGTYLCHIPALWLWFPWSCVLICKMGWIVSITWAWGNMIRLHYTGPASVEQWLTPKLGSYETVKKNTSSSMHNYMFHVLLGHHIIWRKRSEWENKELNFHDYNLTLTLGHSLSVTLWVTSHFLTVYPYQVWCWSWVTLRSS